MNGCSWSNHSAMYFEGSPPSFGTFIMLVMGSSRSHVHGLKSSPNSFLLKGGWLARLTQRCFTRTLSTRSIIIAAYVDNFLITYSDGQHYSHQGLLQKASKYMRFGWGQVLCFKNYVAYKPITLSCILFMFIKMIFIHCHSCVMFAMKYMSMCND